MTVSTLFGPSWATRIQVTIGLLVAAALILINFNVPSLGDPFGPQVPVEQWFQHRLQWDPIIGCGTELCQ